MTGYITHGVFLLIVAALLFVYRAKVAWGEVFLGIFLAFLLLSTPAGLPLQEAADGLAASIREAGNIALNSITKAVG